MKQPDPKPKKPSILTSPRFRSLLYTGTSIATTLAVVALMEPKRPPLYGE